MLWVATLFLNHPEKRNAMDDALREHFVSALDMPLEQVFAQGSQAQGIWHASTGHRESVNAFLKRREHA